MAATARSPKSRPMGACDTTGAHAAIAGRDTRATIPPRKDAVPWGNDHPQHVILAGIEAMGLADWKEGGFRLPPAKHGRKHEVSGQATRGSTLLAGV